MVISSIPIKQTLIMPFFSRLVRVPPPPNNQLVVCEHLPEFEHGRGTHGPVRLRLWNYIR
ncbi:MAG: DUF3299 domain-containing protein [Solirubrobacterales bacterium]